jgi:hypothetical protein
MKESRDTGKASSSLRKFDPSKTAIVIVDMWNWH